jgi:hypothetical protein
MCNEFYEGVIFIKVIVIAECAVCIDACSTKFSVFVFRFVSFSLCFIVYIILYIDCLICVFFRIGKSNW